MQNQAVGDACNKALPDGTDGTDVRETCPCKSKLWQALAEGWGGWLATRISCQ